MESVEMRGKGLPRAIRKTAIGTYIRLTYRRKARLYCVGAAKTGTHSIASMFDGTVRSAHEAEIDELIKKLLDHSEDRLSEVDLRCFIRRRDRQLCLDVDSSQLNFFILDHLLREFPDSLFLLTVRDCYSWLNSFINDSLRRNVSESWIKLREYRFRARACSHPLEEHALEARGLYTLDGYLSYWASHNNKVLSTVPEDRLMIVKTNEITRRAHDIADFSGLPRGSIRVEHSHSFKNPEKFQVLREIQEAHLEEKVRQFCGPLMGRFFPEIQSIQDAET
jgi:hypothetical protein